MIKLHADIPRDQEIIEKFQRAYENLRKIVDKLEDENRRLRKELEEYRKRHPSIIGIKNGKPYVIPMAENIPESHEVPIKTNVIKKRNPGAQPGHRGYFVKNPS